MTTILLAGKDKAFLEVVKRFFQESGFIVLAANSTVEVRHILKQKEVSLMILDLRLTDDYDESDITGFVLANSLAPNTPKTILLTGPTSKNVLKALRLDANRLPSTIDFVPKSEGIDALFMKVQQMVKTVSNPVIILGAGATKACGGPLTNEILPAAMNGAIAGDRRMVSVEDRENLIHRARKFLIECFNVPNHRKVKKEDCPSLPLVLSMLRRSIELRKPIGTWDGEELINAKRAIEYSIFAVVEAALRQIPQNA